MVAREIRILRNMRLVAHVVKKYQCPENEEKRMIRDSWEKYFKDIIKV